MMKNESCTGATGKKEPVSIYVMDIVQSRMDEIDCELIKLTREIFMMQQKKAELEVAYKVFVEFMETHCVEEEQLQKNKK